MKGSVSDWFGILPAHWQFRKLKFAAMLVTKRPLPNTDEANRIALENVESWSGKFVASDSEYEGEGIEFQNNDLLFGKLRPYLAKVYLATKAGLAIGDFYVLRCSKDITHTFLAHLLRSKSCINIIDSSTYGAKMPRASWEFMGNLPIPLPPIDEQRAIATFLDHKTAQIDSLIDKKRRMIELLKEKRTALISHAVTKGLNPDAPMKDSGVPWLGQVPSHWEVKKLKHLIRALVSGVSVNSESSPAQGDEYGILKTSCVYNYYFEPEENKKILDSEIERACINPRKGAIIISRMNTPDLVGASGYVFEDFPNLFLPDRLWQTLYWQNVDFNPRWLSFYLAAHPMQSWTGIIATGTSPSMKNIGQEEYLKTPIPVPDRVGQDQIVEALVSATQRMDEIIKETMAAIEKLLEYRTSIVSAAVTGQIDVRNYGAA